MTFLLAGLITFVFLLIPAMYFFMEKKYKYMVVTLIINLIITALLIGFSISTLKT